MWFQKKLNFYVGVAQSFTLDDIQYPGNWLETISESEAAELGFEKVKVVGQRGDDRYFDNAEVLENGTLTITATRKDIVTLKSIKGSEIAVSRYAIEIGGIDFSGIKVATDRQTQAMLSGALMVVTRNPQATIDWKGDNGFVTLDAATIGALADAVSAHVQSCFTAERSKVEALHAISDPDDVIAFDPTISI